ncbi:MAG: HAD family hydrolase [Parashewanella sp.]
MEIKPIKAVLFDLDGTLVDTAHDLIAALNLVLTELGFPLQEYQSFKYTVSNGSPFMVKKALPDHSAEQREPIRQKMLSHYTRINGERGGVFPELIDVLTKLTSKNIAIGVVTNKPAHFTHPLLQRLGVIDKLKCVISGNTTTRTKPDPAPMLLAAQQMQIEPEHILYVGDAPRDIEAAKNSNMQSAVAMWGYLSKNDTPELWKADHLLQKPIELLALFNI